MSSISLATMGMFDGPHPVVRNASSGLIYKEEEKIKRPKIFVKEVEYVDSIHKKFKQEFVINVKSIR